MIDKIAKKLIEGFTDYNQNDAFNDSIIKLISCLTKKRS